MEKGLPDAREGSFTLIFGLLEHESCAACEFQSSLPLVNLARLVLRRHTTAQNVGRLLHFFSLPTKALEESFSDIPVVRSGDSQPLVAEWAGDQCALAQQEQVCGEV